MIGLENFLKTSLQDVSKMSWRRLEDVFARRLEEVLETCWRRLAKTSGRRLKNVLKTSWRRFLKTKTKDVLNTSSRSLHQDEGLLGMHTKSLKFPNFQNYMFLKETYFKIHSHRIVTLNGFESKIHIDISHLTLAILKAHSQVWVFGNWKTLKIMKNAFYFSSKLLYVPKIFKFLSWLVGHVSKQLD